MRPEGGYLGSSMDGLYRAPSLPLGAGECFELSDSAFEILELTADGRPLAVSVRFASALESPGRRFVVWQNRGFTEFDLPHVGQTVHVEPATLMSLLFGL